MAPGLRTLLASAVALAWALPVVAQDAAPAALPVVGALARHTEAIFQDTLVRRVSGADSPGALFDWVGPGDRYDDSTMVLSAAWMRDLFARLTGSTCSDAAVDFGRSFPLSQVDSALAERYADIVVTARVLARVRGNPVRSDHGSDATLLAALLGPSGPSAIPDSQRVRRAFERRGVSWDEYCWLAQVAWRRLAALPAADAAPLVRRMYDRMTQ